jgi:YhgE/Pip-like protein
MSADSSATAQRHSPDPRLPVRAGQLLRVRTVWTIPLIMASAVLAVMTMLYISSVVNPLAHLRGLPVAVVNQDRGATIGSHHLDVGQQVQAGLLANPAVSHWLSLDHSSLAQSELAMDRGALYAVVVISPDFTTNLLSASALNTASAAAPQIHILANERAGTIGVQLASGILQPALAAASHQIGQHLGALPPATAQTGATKVILADPVTVTTAQYRPLPASSALGLSAFYIALLTLMCGFLAGTIVNSVVDSALGYAATETGPRWRQRPPVPINRWQTLLIKWAIVAALTAALTALVLLVAAGALGMDAPHPALLWLFSWLCAASVGVGTIALFAVAGGFGQLIAMLIFVYAGLAASGGTVPVQALPGFLRALSNAEPLRQILAGTRSIMYFNAQADAGLTRGTLAAGLGLLVWLSAGTVVVKWYDRKGFYRLDPNVLAHVQDYTSQQATPTPTVSPTTQAASAAAFSEQPQQPDHEPHRSPQNAPHQSGRPNGAR